VSSDLSWVEYAPSQSRSQRDAAQLAQPSPYRTARYLAHLTGVSRLTLIYGASRIEGLAIREFSPSFPGGNGFRYLIDTRRFAERYYVKIDFARVATLLGTSEKLLRSFSPAALGIALGSWPIISPLPTPRRRSRPPAAPVRSGEVDHASI